MVEEVKHAFWCCGLLAAVALLGCTPKKAERLAFDSREMILINRYYNGDVEIDERGLLDLSEHLITGQHRKIERRDYDYTLALTHIRLALLYRHTDRQKDSEEQFRIAMAHSDKSKASQNLRPKGTEIEKRDELIRVVNFLDQNQDVKWKNKVPISSARLAE